MRTRYWTTLTCLLWVGGPGVGCGDDVVDEADLEEKQPEQPGDEVDCSTVAAACAEQGEKRCAADGVDVCTVDEQGCLVWKQGEACAEGERCVDAQCLPCTTEVGTFSDQTVEVDGEQRHYMLHVPPNYDCADPTAVLVDFHGTVSGTVERPEEAYGTVELTALADEKGFIVVRPRARFAPSSGGGVYQWDFNVGDIDRNVSFTLRLLDELRTRLHVDEDKVYASGFSNGTNMAIQMLAQNAEIFSGFGVVGGGVWPNSTLKEPAEGTRFFLATGYRDYMHRYHRELQVKLDAMGVPREQIMEREYDGGHELYGWHYEELWAFLDTGVRPDAGAPNSPWTLDDDGPDATVLELAQTPEGDLVAVGEERGIWRWDHGTDTWSETLAPSGGIAPMWTDVCFFDSGLGYAVGAHGIARSEDAGRTWVLMSPAPEFPGQGFGSSYLQAVACAEGYVVAGGYWTGTRAALPVSTWIAAEMTIADGYAAQVAAMDTDPDGNVVVAGNYYLGRSAAADYASFTRVGVGFGGWSYDVTHADGAWWAVGAEGQIVKSTDDGNNWVALRPAGAGPDLYGVDFFDAMRGVAVGDHGVVLLTSDGGTTWTDVSVGTSAFLGDVVILADGEVVVVGGGGLVARASLSSLSGS